eukprot:CAMPEP_0170888050 /NCGR_PEP_ID=MMETSP0734-20130129/38132_1 /TAXON_ID=186038 /ORGANISM="Fragilariopsis kerguelensis, Strain L26-C5" /LENGTH=114 /DNA_ID=CAMNT_0011275355 /DNA_START=582 /DNA_END=927 /DNA_ORIENTATION=+
MNQFAAVSRDFYINDMNNRMWMNIEGLPKGYVLVSEPFVGEVDGSGLMKERKLGATDGSCGTNDGNKFADCLVGLFVGVKVTGNIDGDLDGTSIGAAVLVSPEGVALRSCFMIP